MRCRPVALVALAPAALAGLLMTAAPALADPGDVAFALQSGDAQNAPAGTLVSFNPESPATFTSSAVISGIPTGVTVLDLAVRPSSGVLYALVGPSGFGASGDKSLYTIDPATGTATRVVAALTELAASTTQYAIAFNPVVDLLRVVGVTDNTNYRVNVDTGAVTTDTKLAYATTDPNKSITPRVTGIGYTAASAGGKLYDYDLRAFDAAPNKILTLQNPPNAGTLNTVGNIDATTQFFGQDLTVGRLSGSEVGYLTGTSSTSSRTNEYRVDLTSGASTDLGPIGPARANSGVFAITIRRAVTPAAAVPEFPLTALALVGGLGLAGTLVVRRRQTASSAA